MLGLRMTRGTGGCAPRPLSVEAGLKLAAVGPSRYFSSSWNRLDFVVLVASLLSQFLMRGDFNVTVFRVTKLARLINVLDGVQVPPRHILTTAWPLFPILPLSVGPCVRAGHHDIADAWVEAHSERPCRSPLHLRHVHRLWTQRTPMFHSVLMHARGLPCCSRANSGCSSVLQALGGSLRRRCVDVRAPFHRVSTPQCVAHVSVSSQPRERGYPVRCMLLWLLRLQQARSSNPSCPRSQTCTAILSISTRADCCVPALTPGTRPKSCSVGCVALSLSPEGCCEYS